MDTQPNQPTQEHLALLINYKIWAGRPNPSAPSTSDWDWEEVDMTGTLDEAKEIQAIYQGLRPDKHGVTHEPYAPCILIMECKPVAE